jgi:hypothetical protein
MGNHSQFIDVLPFTGGRHARWHFFRYQMHADDNDAATDLMEFVLLVRFPQYPLFATENIGEFLR